MNTTSLFDKKIVTIRDKGLFGGVLAGFSYYTGFPVVYVRIVFCLSLILSGPNVLNLCVLSVYVLVSVFAKNIPAPADYQEVTG